MLKKKHDSERLILDTAREHFLAYGYNGVKLRDIASGAGVTTGALYHHFSGKDDLFVEVCVEGLHKLLARLQESARRTERHPVHQRFLSFFDAYISFFVEERGYYELIERMQAGREGVRIAPHLAAKADEINKKINDFLVQAFKGEMDKSDDPVYRKKVLLLIAWAEGLFQSERKGILRRFGISFEEVKAMINERMQKLIEVL